MKQQLQRIAKRIDAMTLRERVITFATAGIALIFLIDSFLIEPQFIKQKNLLQQISQDRAKIAEIQASIQQKIRAHSIDPDADNMLRLQSLKQQYSKAQDGLMSMQKGLISPDKMAGVLEDILRRNGNLRLISLRTLAVASLEEAAGQAAGTSTSATATTTGSATSENVTLGTGSIYKHGVEITLQGGYLDMLNYMNQLEAMPWQLFWSKADLTADDYPKATLTLTLFTLSLDKKWLNL